MEFGDVLATRDAPADRGGWPVTIDTGTGLDSADTGTGRSDPAAGGATPDVAGSSQADMATPSPNQLGPRVVRAPDPWTYDRDHTWAGTRAVRLKRH
jgi:hypothetical protein